MITIVKPKKRCLNTFLALEGGRHNQSTTQLHMRGKTIACMDSEPVDMTDDGGEQGESPSWQTSRGINNPPAKALVPAWREDYSKGVGFTF
jgi:hypothetical protein